MEQTSHVWCLRTSKNAKSAPRTAIFTALWPQRVTVLAMGCDAYGDAAMFGEGAVAKPPPEELEANDEVGKLRAYYSALKAGKTWDAPATVDFLND